MTGQEGQFGLGWKRRGTCWGSGEAGKRRLEPDERRIGRARCGFNTVRQPNILGFTWKANTMRIWLESVTYMIFDLTVVGRGGFS